MAYEENMPRMEGAHHVILEGREQLSVSGVEEVESFDEESGVLHTTKGVLVIRGQQLQLQTLSIDGGQVAVDGTVDAMSYEEAQRKGGLFSRLLR